MKKAQTETWATTGTTTWVRHDYYLVEIPCRNRIISALNALLLGRTVIIYQVPATSRNKKLVLQGKRIENL